MFKTKKSKILAAALLSLPFFYKEIDYRAPSAFASERLENKIANVRINGKEYGVDEDYGITSNGKIVEDEEELLKVAELAKLVEEAKKVQDYKIDFFGLWDLEAMKYSSLVRKGQGITMKYDEHIKWALSFPVKFLNYALSGTLDIPKEGKEYVLNSIKKFLESPKENLKNYAYMVYNESNQKLEENATLIRRIGSSGFIDEETATRIKDNSNYAEIFGNAALEYYKELQRYDPLEKRWLLELLPGLKDISEKDYGKLSKAAIAYLEKEFLFRFRNYPPNKRFEELIEENRNNLIRKKSEYMVSLKNFMDMKLFGSPENVFRNSNIYLCNRNFDRLTKMVIKETRDYISKVLKEVDKKIQEDMNNVDLWEKEMCNRKEKIIYQDFYKDYAILFYKTDKVDKKIFFVLFHKDKSKWGLLPQFNDGSGLDENKFKEVKDGWRNEIEEYHQTIGKRLEGEEERMKVIEERGKESEKEPPQAKEQRRYRSPVIPLKK